MATATPPQEEEKTPCCRCPKKYLWLLFCSGIGDIKKIRKGLSEMEPLVDSDFENLHRQENVDNAYPLVFLCDHHHNYIIPEAFTGPYNPKIKNWENITEATAEYTFFHTGYNYLIETGIFKESLVNLRDEFSEAANSGNGHFSDDQIKKFFGIERRPREANFFGLVEVKPEEPKINLYVRAVDVFLYLLVKYAHPNISHPNPKAQRGRLAQLLAYSKLVVSYREKIRRRDNNHQFALYVWRNVADVVQALLNRQFNIYAHDLTS